MYPNVFRTLRVSTRMVSRNIFLLGCLLLLGLLCCCVTVVGGWTWRTWTGERHLEAALPSTARNIQAESVTPFPAWHYYLKAELSADEFAVYVQDLDLVSCTTGGWHWLDAPAWWDPAGDISQNYCNAPDAPADIDVWVKYEAGYLYLRAVSQH